MDNSTTKAAEATYLPVMCMLVKTNIFFEFVDK
jgi:hypothetical protein